MGTTEFTTSLGDGTVLITSDITTITDHRTVLTTLSDGTEIFTYYTEDQFTETLVTTSDGMGSEWLTTATVLVSSESGGSSSSSGGGSSDGETQQSSFTAQSSDN